MKCKTCNTETAWICNRCSNVAGKGEVDASRIDELISLWVDVKYKVDGAKLIHPDHKPEAISDIFNALVREGRCNHE